MEVRECDSRTVVSYKESDSPSIVTGTETGSGVALRYPGFRMLFLIWTVIGIVTSLRFQFRGGPDLAFIAACTISYYPWIALAPVVFRIEKQFPLGTGGWLRNVAVLAGISVPICLIASPLMIATFTAALSNLGPARTQPFNIPWYVHLPLAQMLFWCIVAGGYLVRTQFQLRQHEQRAAQLAVEKSQLEAGLKQAQLDVLRARLNPHFLFNSLQNISAMTKQDPQTASRMLARLGDLLRAVLGQHSNPESTVQSEIELTRAYVSLEQLRFGDRLQVHFDIDPETQTAMVPCFLLQPLIENAVVHGLRGVSKTGIIAVSSEKQSDELVLKVTDNGTGPPDGGSAEMKVGIGLGSTRERLAAMYPRRHDLVMRGLEEGGTEIRIALPFRLREYDDRSPYDELSATADR